MFDEARNPAMRVLVVDDEPEIRRSLNHFLTDVGYAVQTSDDGVAALIEIQRDLPDILLSDLNMPGMSGFDLLAVVRKCFPSIQVIAMSGSFSGEEVPSGVFADSFYQKGCSGRSLLRILQELERMRMRPVGNTGAMTPRRLQQTDPVHTAATGTSYFSIGLPQSIAPR
jgi:CheY-like chemotaxis protein